MIKKFSTKEILSVDKLTYTEHFNTSEFGFSLGQETAHGLGYQDKLIRRPEGSSLVFELGRDHFLKMTPPFFAGSIEAEIAATKLLGPQFPFNTPSIIHEGQIENWKFIVTKKVPGIQAKNVFKLMSDFNKKTFAEDVGKVIKELRKLDSAHFKRDIGDWQAYLANNLKNQKAIHLERGNSPVWSQKIEHFVQKHSGLLLSLGPAKMIHADLNHEHLMLAEVNNEWRVTGLLDFADSMSAPVELEFILPILCFFKGNRELQKLVWESAEYLPHYKSEQYSNIMMVLTLQNRFIAFHDWFSGEIEKGAESVEEIAQAVFPLF